MTADGSSGSLRELFNRLKLPLIIKTYTKAPPNTLAGNKTLQNSSWKLNPPAIYAVCKYRFRLSSIDTQKLIFRYVEVNNYLFQIKKPSERCTKTVANE